MWWIAARMLGGCSVAGFILASVCEGGRALNASSATTTGMWSEDACPVNSVGFAAAAIHLHDVSSVGRIFCLSLCGRCWSVW
jgi:hypothetical protein